ncbi:MAG: 1-acyl-sn-glycerol-3-phosphate acyltransferase [Methylococcales bacterium]|nr:1-acyl-sn-glycerol-3-phosphate acyltransferase [Methylococcales bacterium]MBT7411350.1 1-acyl-sn-glycerol-3-phosphate acyltransferase [Methylococcales bacterium]
MNNKNNYLSCDWGVGWANKIDFWTRRYVQNYHRYQFQTIPLPRSGPAIIASNHISGIDSMLLVSACERPLRFLIAKEYYHNICFNWLCKVTHSIPVDRAKKPENSLRHAYRALQQGEVVVVFPDAGFHIDSDPPKKIKGGASWLSKQTNTPIFPVRIEGIKAEKKIVSPVFIRSHAKLIAFEPLIPDDFETKHEITEKLQNILRGKNRNY